MTVKQGEEFRTQAGRPDQETSPGTDMETSPETGPKTSPKTGLEPGLVKQLCRLDDRHAWRSLVETTATIALAIGAAMVWWHPLTVIAAVVVIATRQQALFILAHDAAHYRLFADRRVNEAVGRLCGAVVGISMRTYRVIHRLHHNHLYQPADPDMPLHAGYPRGRGYLVRKLLGDLLGGTAWKTYRYFFGHPALNTGGAGGGPRPLDDTTPRLRAQARRDRWFVAAVQAGLLAGALAAGVALEYAILWLLPLVTLLQAILRLRAVCEHGAIRDPGSAFTAARTNLGPAWLRWLLFPHQVNYHLAHHLYPAVPHYNLPACHRALERAGLLAGAEVSALPATWRRINGPRAASA